MADSAKPESIPEDLTFGELEALFRGRRRLSRAQLVLRMDRERSAHSEKYLQLDAAISESLLRQIEEGSRVKINPPLIEILCEALQCSHAERFALLIAAGRNSLAGPDGKIDPGARVLLWIMDEVYRHPKAQHLLERLVQDNKVKAANLTQREVFEILETILKLVKSGEGSAG
jgi:hypothetical protein